MAEKKIQKTLSYKLSGKTVVSKPFDFEAACLVDNRRFTGSGIIGYMSLGKDAVNYMFDGTEVTEEVIEAMPIKERKELCEQAAMMYFDALSETGENSKNE